MGTRPGSPETVVVGNWQLLDAFLTEVNFGAQDYGSEEMVDISIGGKYGWAEEARGEVQARGS